MSNQNQDAVREGQKVTLLLHNMQFPATVTAVNDDGSIRVEAISKFGHAFNKNRVTRATAIPVPELHNNEPYWTDAT